MKLLVKVKRYYKRAYGLGHYPSIWDVLFAKKKIYVYYGFLGDQNFGDELVFESSLSMQENSILIPVQRHMPLELMMFIKFRINKIKGVFLGGGTLLTKQPYNSKLMINLLHKNVPLYLHGTGTNTNIDGSFWKNVFSIANICGGVRGDYSVNLIKKSIQVDVDKIGDAAIVLFEVNRAKNNIKNDHKKEYDILINFGTHDYLKSSKNSRYQVHQFLKKIKTENPKLKIAYLPLHNIDLDIGIKLQSHIQNLDILPIPKTLRDAVQVFSKTSYAIGERLHFIVTAAILGCHFYSINYTTKHNDFLNSINAQQRGIDINNVSEDVLYKNYKNKLGVEEWESIFSKLQNYKAKQLKTFEKFSNF